VHSVTLRLRSNDDYLIVNIKNSGNVLLKAEGHLWLYGQHSSTPWVSVPLSIDTTVPGTAVHYPVHWTHRAPRGTYRYAVHVTWQGGSASAGDAPTGAVTDQIRWAGGTSTAHGVVSVH
jgi:hypothetical protein